MKSSIAKPDNSISSEDKESNNLVGKPLEMSPLGVTPQVFSSPHISRSRLKKHKLSIGLSVLFFIVALVTCFYILPSSISNKNTQAELDQVTEQASLLVANYKYDEAIAVWQDFLAQPLSSDIKCEAELRFSGTYLDAGKYSEANDRFLEVKKDCSEVDEYLVYLGLAKSYEGFGDITNSIENYQKVIDIENQRQQNPPKDFDKSQSEQSVARYTEIIEVLRFNL